MTDWPIAEVRAREGAPPSWRRPVRGTLVLAAIGAGAGALLGTTLLAAVLAGGPGGPSRYDLPLGLVLGGPIGAVAGGFAAPLLGWTVLREVPLGRALWMGAVGTVLGAWSGAPPTGAACPGLWWTGRAVGRTPRWVRASRGSTCVD
jgi:hypothetical protein